MMRKENPPGAGGGRSSAERLPTQAGDSGKDGRGRPVSAGLSSEAIFLSTLARRSFPSRSALAAALRRYSTRLSALTFHSNRSYARMALVSFFYTVDPHLPFQGVALGLVSRALAPGEAMGESCKVSAPSCSEWGTTSQSSQRRGVTPRG